MFDFDLFYLLILICIPGILSTIPMLSKTYDKLLQRPSNGKLPPTRRKFIIISIIQTSVIAVIAADIGAYLSPKIGIGAPFLSSVAKLTPDYLNLYAQLIPAVIFGVIGTILFLTAYYFFFLPRLDQESIDHMHELRMSVGLTGRLLYGGIVEEILCRWCLMSIFIWMGVLLCGKTDIFVMWTAIILSGILFSLGHIPAYIAFGCKSSQMLMTTIMTMNLLAAVIFGWLFWHHGLTAAIIAHMIFHVIWYPFDLRKA